MARLDRTLNLLTPVLGRAFVGIILALLPPIMIDELVMFRSIVCILVAALLNVLFWLSLGDNFALFTLRFVRL